MFQNTNAHCLKEVTLLIATNTLLSCIIKEKWWRILFVNFSCNVTRNIYSLRKTFIFIISFKLTEFDMLFRNRPQRIN